MATAVIPQYLSSPTEFIFSVKLSWDDRHQVHTSLLWKLGCHANHSDISITPLSLSCIKFIFAAALPWNAAR